MSSSGDDSPLLPSGVRTRHALSLGLSFEPRAPLDGIASHERKVVWSTCSGSFPIAHSIPKPCGASSHETLRWRKADSNSRSRRERNGRWRGARGQPSPSRERTCANDTIQPIGPTSLFGNTRQTLSRERDREFESAFLQQPVCLSSEPCGYRRKAPHFGGGLRVVGDVRRDAKAANRASFALSL